MTRISDSHRALSSQSRVELLHELQRATGPLTVAALAEAVGLHPNTVREHLDRLVAAGFVAADPEKRATRGRPRLLYRAVDREAGASLDERLRSYLLDVLVTGYGRPVPAPSVAARDAGEQWGLGLDEEDATPRPSVAEVLGDAAPQVAALEVHLEDLGMRPELEVDPLRLHLHRCPYAALARKRPDVVCAVHLGIVRGVLARHDGPVVAERLEPFVGPEHCVLHLARADAPSAIAPA